MKHADFKRPKTEQRTEWDIKSKRKKRCSAREIPIGEVQTKKWKLLDKIVEPIIECAHCGSNSTYHAWVQKHGDLIGNVYSAKREKEEKGQMLMKFDYCFDCQREFLIEAFLWGLKE